MQRQNVISTWRYRLLRIDLLEIQRRLHCFCFLKTVAGTALFERTLSSVFHAFLVLSSSRPTHNAKIAATRILSRHYCDLQAGKLPSSRLLCNTPWYNSHNWNLLSTVRTRNYELLLFFMPMAMCSLMELYEFCEPSLRWTLCCLVVFLTFIIMWLFEALWV